MSQAYFHHSSHFNETGVLTHMNYHQTLCCVAYHYEVPMPEVKVTVNGRRSTSMLYIHFYQVGDIRVTLDIL